MPFDGVTVQLVIHAPSGPMLMVYFGNGQQSFIHCFTHLKHLNKILTMLLVSNGRTDSDHFVLFGQQGSGARPSFSRSTSQPSLPSDLAIHDLTFTDPMVALPRQRRTRFAKDKAYVCSFPGCGASFYHRSNATRHECHKHGRQRIKLGPRQQGQVHIDSQLLHAPMRDPHGRPSLTATIRDQEDCVNGRGEAFGAKVEDSYLSVNASVGGCELVDDGECCNEDTDS